MLDNRANLLKVIADLIHTLRTLPSERLDLVIVAVKESGLINPKWYLSTYPDVARSRFTPFAHFVLFGYSEGRSPSPELAGIPPFILQQMDNKRDNLKRYLEKVLALLATADENGTFANTTLIRQGAFETLYDMPLYVHWSITKMCNYQCSYCSYLYGQDKKFDRRALTPFNKLMNVIANLASLNRPQYEVVILGGEPTLEANLPDLLNEMSTRFSERLKKLTVVTNGSRDAAWLNRLKVKRSGTSTLISISIHAEQANPAHIYSLVRDIDPDIDLDFVLMLHPEKLDLVKEIHTQLCKLREERPFDVFLQPILEPPHFQKVDSRYQDDFFTWRNNLQTRFASISMSSASQYNKVPSLFNTFWQIETYGHPSIVRGEDRSVMQQNGLLDFQGMHCVCGTNLARIDEDGFLHGAVCNYSMTNINMHEPNAMKDSGFMHIVECPSTLCACNDNDINIKFKDREEAAEYLRIAMLKQERILLP